MFCEYVLSIVDDILDDMFKSASIVVKRRINLELVINDPKAFVEHLKEVFGELGAEVIVERIVDGLAEFVGADEWKAMRSGEKLSSFVRIVMEAKRIIG